MASSVQMGLMSHAFFVLPWSTTTTISASWSVALTSALALEFSASCFRTHDRIGNPPRGIYPRIRLESAWRRNAARVAGRPASPLWSRHDLAVPCENTTIKSRSSSVPAATPPPLLLCRPLGHLSCSSPPIRLEVDLAVPGELDHRHPGLTGLIDPEQALSLLRSAPACSRGALPPNPTPCIVKSFVPRFSRDPFVLLVADGDGRRLRKQERAVQ